MAVLRLVPAAGPPLEVTTDEVLIGREEGCDLVIANGSVSRRHALVQRRGGAWFVVDQNSANGTFVDSARVTEAALRDGQELRFGAMAYRVEIAGDAPATDATVLTPLVEATVIQPSAGARPPGPPPRPPAAAPPRPAPPPPRPAATPPPPPAGGPAVPPPPPGPPRAASVPPPPPPRPGAPSAPLGEPVVVVEEPPAPAKKGRGPLFWVGGGCCGCLVLILLLVGAFSGWLYYMTQGAADAVHGQLKELKAGQTEAAYQRMSESYRSRVSPEAFQALVARHPALKSNADSTFRNRSVHNDTAELIGFLTATSGEREDVTYHLVREGGAWKISDLELPGERLRPDDARRPRGMQVEASVDKRREGGMVRVAIRVEVSGFEVRPEGDHYAIDLAEDVETMGPDGQKIEALSREDIQRYQANTSLAQGAVAPFTTNLTLDPASAPGTYTVRLIVRDLVGKGQASREVSFELP
jgi:FHA domain-containing protein/uncharacterized protein DUF4864